MPEQNTKNKPKLTNAEKLKVLKKEILISELEGLNHKKDVVYKKPIAISQVYFEVENLLQYKDSLKN